MGNYSYYGPIGNFNEEPIMPVERKDIVIQSLWTKPITDKKRLCDIIIISALSLAYAHRSGYKVHMHTDSKGYELLKDFGYDKLLKTLDDIPDTVPTELFAAGKFYAMKAEGVIGKVHVDYDVFLKKPGVLDRFYRDVRVDAICQCEEDFSNVCYADKAKTMHIIGYPSTTRPDWQGSMNTGIVGFNNALLAAKYFDNYFKALEIYTKDVFEAFKKKHKTEKHLLLDFVLEQATLSFMSLNFNVYTLLPMYNPCEVADELGYQHLQGSAKWSSETRVRVRELLEEINPRLYMVSKFAAARALR